MSASAILKVLRILAICFVLSAHAQEDEAEMIEQTTQLPNATTEEIITEFSLEVHHINSTSNTICVAWRARVPDDITVDKYHVYSHLKGSESYIHSPDLPASAYLYTIEDLVRDEEFIVCVVATIVNGSLTNAVQTNTYHECLDAYTIPYMRPDSVYVLFIMVMVIVALILMAICLWRRDLKRFRDAQDKKSLVSIESKSDDDDDDYSDEGNIFPDEPVVASPYNRLSKSLVEEEEVPFMSKDSMKPENGVTFSVN